MFDLNKVDNKKFSVQNNNPFFFEGSYTENGILTTVKKYFFVEYSPQQDDYFKYEYKYIAQVEQESNGSKLVDYYYCNKQTKQKVDKRFVISLLDQKINNIGTNFGASELFVVKISELKTFNEKFKTLCEKLDENKKKFEKTNKIVKISPEVDFKKIHSDFASFVYTLENYLLNSFRYNLLKTQMGVGEITYDEYFFIPTMEIPFEESQKLLQKASVSFCLIPRAVFLKNDFTKISVDQNEYTQTEDIFHNWIDIKKVSFYGEDVEKYLDLEKYYIVDIYRSFLYGEYEPLKDILTKPFVRGIFENFQFIEKVYFDDKIPIDWMDFCAAFLRPSIFVEYEAKEAKASKTRVLHGPLKNLQQKADEDKRLADERKSRAEVAANQKSENDTGILSDIIKEIKAASDADGLYSVLNKVVLKNLVSASIDCVDQFVTVPDIKIPNINVPSFDFSFKVTVNDISGDMYKKILDKMIQVSFKNAVDAVKKFFTVQDCEDLQSFMSSEKYSNFYNDLKSSIKKDFMSIIENLKGSFIELANQLQKDLCNPELFLVSLYSADKVLSPKDVLSLCSGKLEDEKASKFADYIDLNNSMFFGLECSSLEPSELNIIYSFVGAELNDWMNLAEESLQEDPVDVFYQSSIKCESAFDGFVDWLRENGFSKDVINCVVDKNLEEKNKFLLDLYAYVNSDGIFNTDKIQVEDDSLKETSRMIFDSHFAFLFDNWNSIIENYKEFSKSNNQPVNLKLKDRAASVFSSINVDTNGYLFNNVNKSLVDSGFSSDNSYGSGDFNVGKVARGQSFWDVVVDFNQHPDRFSFKTTNNNKNFVFSYTLIDGREETVEFFRDISNFSLPNQLLILKNDEKYEIFNDFNDFNKDFDQNKDNFTGYSKYLSALLSERVSNTYKNRVILFEKFFDGDFYKYLQRYFVEYLQKEYFLFRTNIFDTIIKTREDGSKISINLFDLFVNSIKKVVEAPVYSGYCSLFSREEWILYAESITRDVYNQYGEYDEGAISSKLAVKIKSRLLSMFFNLSTPGTLKYFNEFGDSAIRSYLISKFSPELKDIIEDGYIFDNFVNIDSIKRENYERFKVDSYLEAPDALDAAFPGFVENAYIFPEMEVNKAFGENLELTSRCFSSMFNNKPIGIFKSFIDGLQFRHYNDYVPYEVEGVSINSHYNNIGLIEGKSALFLEVVYYENGVRKCFHIKDAGRVFRNGVNQFVNYAPVLPFSFEDMASLDSYNKIEKIHVNLSFAQYNYSFSGRLFGSGVDDIGYIVPIVNINIDKMAFRSLVYNFMHNGQYDGSGESQKKLQDYILGWSRERIYESKSYRQDFIHVCALDKIYECFKILLHNVSMSSSDLSNIFDLTIKTNTQSAEDVSINYNNDLKKFKNDTFGIIRSFFAKSNIQKMALKMAIDTPKLIFKAQVEASDPNIMIARRIVDVAKTMGKNLDIRFVSLIALLPVNLWTIPPGYGPPITPQGLAYLFLDFVDDDDTEKENFLENYGTLDEKMLEFYKDILNHMFVPCLDDKDSNFYEPQETCFVRGL